MQVHSLGIEDFCEEEYALIWNHSFLFAYTPAYVINQDLKSKCRELQLPVSGNKTKLIPMVVGAAVGAAVCGPGAIALGAKAGAGYIAAGGSVLGGIAAKNIT